MFVSSKSNGMMYEFDRLYKILVAHIFKLEKKADPEVILHWIQSAADFARQSHTGRYSDGRIENIAFEIGQNLERISSREHTANIGFDVPCFEKSRRRRHVLHVATMIYNVGGHTRLINSWIENDNTSRHSLLLINQKNLIPDWISETIRENRGHLIVFPPDAPLILKAKWLRKIVQSNVNVTILHHHPYDVVPIVAFATGKCPPVAIMDHADHAFWIGSTIADTVINFRTFAKTLSEKRRFAKHTTFLPIPISVDLPIITRLEARKQLNIPDTEVMLLSIGGGYKYKPMDKYNFFKTSVKILEQNSQAHLYLIGVEWDEKVKYLRDAIHNRVHLEGIIENTTLYQAAADIYIEGFPYGSWSAILELCAAGVCPVLKLSPIAEYMVIEDIALTGIVDHAMTEDEYIERVKFLIRNQTVRESIGKQVKEKVIAYHAGHEWHNYLRDFYLSLENTLHSLGPIPVSDCTETRNDLVLSRHGELRYGNASARKETVGRIALCWAKYHLDHKQYGLTKENLIFVSRMKPALLFDARIISFIGKLLQEGQKWLTT